MTDLLLYYTYFYVTLETLFFVGAAVYCVRLTRITGAFRAWLLLIAALGLLAFLVLASYVKMILFESPATLEADVRHLLLRPSSVPA